MSRFELIKGGLFDSKITDLSKYDITPLRRVTQYELELFVNDGFYTSINGTPYPIVKDRVIIAKPGDMRNSKLHFEALFMHLSVSDNDLREMLDALPHYIIPSDAVAIRDIIMDLSLINEDNTPYARAKALAQMFRLIYLLAKDANYMIREKEFRSTIGLDSINKAILYMEQNFDKNISLTQISQAAFMSPSYFHKLFCQTCKTTPAKWLKKYRLHMADSLLKNSDISVSDIAFNCGFSSQTYFDCVYKNYRGMSPSEYRLKCREQYKL